ncbi:UDP-glycosyltransferase 73B4-like [Panicum virgatum]|uniref:Glycosyltransferase n=1 Tax=Panicum virgatum TaxID=38727 RepID=A0A8T0TS25_PANVG|nr:UDP-glycosyltransferase 73B4-like [Panicum virgatum]KAG2612568.1 hypothetical protein PVAP13_4KG299300 [Panicum virgatum]
MAYAGAPAVANAAAADNGARSMANATTAINAAAATAHHGANGAPASGSGRDHVVIFPFMAKGHMLPLLHLATALSARRGGLGLRVTLVTTPGNVAFARSRLPASVSLVALPFPPLPPLPAGVESTNALPSPSLHLAFLRATALLRAPFAAFLASLPSPPLALVSDFFLGFTRRVAANAGVRRVVFNGMSCFASAICKALAASPPASFEPGAQLRVPALPDHVVVWAEEVPDGVANRADPDNPFTRFFAREIGDSDVRSWGVLVNSFAALDGDYVPGLESFYEPGSRAWLVGPLFLAAAGDDMSPEGEKEHDPEGCLAWLDERAAQPGSVVYVSFGTQAHVTDAQLDELVHGLARSGRPFLWAVRSDTWSPPAGVGPDGRIVRGWVPQRSVLAHRAVGGFVSHCGWNSVMESLAAGKPLLAWPMIAEQHLNARHVANILGVGVRVAVRPGAGVVGRADVEEKVRELMDAGSKAARSMRERAAWAQQAAESAVSRGGTSATTLRNLVEELQRTYGDVVGKESEVRGTK